MVENKVVPEICFREFDKEWFSHYLKEFLEFQNGFNAGGDVYGSGTALISVMDILYNNFITYDAIRGKANVSAEDKKRYAVEYGDVLFQRSSENFEDARRPNVYLDLVLALRYKELFSGGGSGGGSDDVPYEIDTHLTEINTGRIDRDYMNTRFTKYLKALQDGSETADVLNELHKSFAILTHEEQKYAHMFLVDVQRGSKSVKDGKTLSDYIAEYQMEARNDRIHRFAASLGIDETQLRSFMSRNVTAEDINDFGLYDKLLASVDRSVAREYIEKAERQTVKPFRIPLKIDKLLRQFILSGGFDVG